ncbi:MAG: carboxypeptidase-like regulatory domain-containing protein, partial [Planctomycetota bacterium]
MKGYSAALAFFLLIAAGGWWWADHSRDTYRIEQHLRTARREFEKIPEEAFVRDRANVLEGRVVDGRGGPLGNAKLRVLQADAVEDSLGRVLAGGWPDPAPEVEGKSEADGSFRFSSLAYGSKILVVRAPAGGALLLPEIPFADGYGAREIDAVLAAPPALTWTLLQTDGSPAAGIEISFLPRSLAGERLKSLTDSRGLLRVAAEARTRAGEPRLLAGNPPVLLAPPGEEGSLSLPPAHDLILIVHGAPEGASLGLTLFPDGALLPGAWKASGRIRSGRLVIPRVRDGFYELLMTTDSLTQWTRFLHDGNPHEVLLHEPRRLEVKIMDAAGHPLPSRVAWQPVPFLPPAVFETDPLLQLAPHHPQRRVVETGAD